MKRKLSLNGKIFLSLLLVAVMLVSAVVPSAALSVNSKYKFTSEWLSDFGYYTAAGRTAMIRKIVIKSTNEPIYCIDFKSKIETDGSGSGTVKATDITGTSAYKSMSAVGREGVRLATVFGCRNTTNNAAYAATQVVIWEYQLGMRTSVAPGLNTACTSAFASYVNGNSSVKTYYTQIMNSIKNYKAVLPSFAGKTFTLTGTGLSNGITLTDSNKVLKYYHLTNNAGLAAKRSTDGNTIRLYMAKNASYKENVRVVGTRDSIDVYGSGAAVGLVEAGQTLWYGRMDDPKASVMSFDISTQYGNGQIVKKNSSNPEDVKGFTFRIYNSSNKLVKTVVSGADGSTPLFELPVGTYTVKEVLTDSKYVPVPDRTITIEKGTAHTIQITNAYIPTFPVYMEKTMQDGESPEGFEFVLTGKDKDGNAVSITATVDANGKATFANVPVSNAAGYTVSEKTQSDKYFCYVDDNTYSKTSYKIVVTKNGVQGIGNSDTNPLKFVNVRTSGRIRIQKLSSDNEPIHQSGFVFKVYDSNTNLPITAKCQDEMTDTFVTDNEGKVVLEEVENGRYYVKEVDCPYGYTLNEESTPSKDINSNSISFTVEDAVQHGQLTIFKQGKMFTTVNKDGETSVPVYENAYLQDAVFEIRAAADIYEAGSVAYHQGDVVKTVTTGTEGKAVTDVPLGSYQIKEVKAPAGHVLNDTVYSVEINATDKTTEVFFADKTVTDEFQVLDIRFNKLLEMDETFGIGYGNEYADVSFGLFAGEEYVAQDGSAIHENDLIAVAHMENDGTVHFSQCVPEGEYYVKELTTNEHYVLNDREYAFEYLYNEGSEKVNSVDIAQGEEITNELIKGSIDGYKYNELGKPLQGAVIGLFAKDTTDYTEENALVVTTSDENGSFEFENVPFGEYVVVELVAPADHLLTDAVWGVTISEPDEVKRVEILNNSIKGDLMINKVDDEGNFVDNVRFTVYQDTNGNGQFDEEDLPYDITRKPSELRLEKSLFESWFTSAQEEDETVTVEEFAKFAATGFDSYLRTGEVPEGFNTILNSSEDLLKSSIEQYLMESNKDMSIAERLYPYFVWLHYQPTEEIDGMNYYSCTGLAKGNYFVKETETPKGYVADTNAYPFSIEENNAVVTVSNVNDETFVNKIVRGTLRILKVDENKKPLPGAVFEVYTKDGKFVDSITSGKDGYATLTGLKYGEYVVKETKAPKGYKITEVTYPFSISENEQVVDLICTNKLIPVNAPKTNKVKAATSTQPNTGDSFALFVFIGLSVLASIGVATTVVTLVRKRKMLKSAK